MSDRVQTPIDPSSSAKPRLRMIMMGTGPFAVPSFEAVRAAGHEIALVVTRPQPAVKSRKGPPPSPVRQWADEHSLPIIDPVSINDETTVVKLRDTAAQLSVVCDYGQILKPPALEATELGGINLHGSLLPKYRGAAPVQWAMLSGDSVTGVSVIHMTPRLDGGPIIALRETPIRDDETAGELEERLAKIGVEAMLDAVDELSRWDRTTPIGEFQDPSNATKAPRLKKADGQIDWSQTARMIDCHVRGMQPWPVAFSFVSVSAGKPPLRAAIKQIEILDRHSDGYRPGEIVKSDGGMIVACSDRLVAVRRIQPAGKRDMDGNEFMRGYQPDVGSVLTTS